MHAQILTLPKNESRALSPAAAQREQGAEPTFDSETLLQGHREVLIRHGDRVYRLRHTSNDKLILTK